ncbi:malonyl-CoA O-methyltransferase [Syntrophotalea carbinolica DSM 2380]|uniref:Malonyl-[acyl-carrier protein] O-methyltransferase n=1 Tax=Syntrophotalea carbinolica (strain DSM 2380 / NBRC 103641 / GraBd1) TaxID=338963 RepID=Q3A400_SYNC1|nr:methyltransferase domain-containing protein [Syntrophotalea carbinolica]ABA88907.1 malonyl-CoA O-methyltransferase [Syntrophotalea carbinolica DSM 2380]
MTAIDRRQVRQHFSASSAVYDDHAQVQKRVAQRVASLVHAEAPSAGRLLEIGTGTGYLTRQIVRENPQLRPLVSDLAHGMTVQARQNVPAALALDLDASSLSLKSGSMAVICSSSVYQWVEDLNIAFGESLRVLQDGGIFIFALFGEKTLWELKECYRESVIGEEGRAPDHMLALPDKATVENALRDGGFKIFRVWEENECENHATVTDLLRAIKGVGAHNASSRRPRGLASRRVMARLQELYTRRFNVDGFLPATYHVIYGVAHKCR